MMFRFLEYSGLRNLFLGIVMDGSVGMFMTDTWVDLVNMCVQSPWLSSPSVCMVLVSAMRQVHLPGV